MNMKSSNNENRSLTRTITISLAQYRFLENKLTRIKILNAAMKYDKYMHYSQIMEILGEEYEGDNEGDDAT